MVPVPGVVLTSSFPSRRSLGRSIERAGDPLDRSQHLGRIIACELVCAARGIDLRQPLQPAEPTAAALAALREAGVAGPGPDRWLSPELGRAEAMVMSGEMLAAVERVTGPLD